MTSAAPSLRRPDGSALRVLVVDDEQMLTDLLSMALRMEGGRCAPPDRASTP
jgi:two-component system OmpR family response regulator